MHFQTKVPILILICVLPPLVRGSEHVNSDEIIKQKLEEFIPPLMKCRNVLGLTIALVRGNRTVYTRGFGTRDQERNLNVTASTLFPIASQSKAFSATLAADAVSRGAASWDSPLKGILGEDFKLQDEFRTEKASIRDCFAHRLGMRSFWGVTIAQMNISLEELVMRRLRYFPTRYDLRQKWSYSNYNTALGAYAVERATEEKWEDAIYQRIFQPIGMTQSRVSARMTEADWENFAYSYTTDQDSGEFVPVRDGDVIGFVEAGGTGASTNFADTTATVVYKSEGSGLPEIIVKGVGDCVIITCSHSAQNRTVLIAVPQNDSRAVVEDGLKMNELPAPMAVMSSADDIAKWMRFHLRADGMTDHGTDLMKGSALRETHRPSIAYYRLVGDRRPTFPIADTVSAYGMGWYIGTYRGYKKIYHTGSINSHACRMVLLPEEDVGAWACINSDVDGGWASNVGKLSILYALDLMLGLEPWLNKTSACTYPAPWQPQSNRVRRVQKPPSNKTIDTKQYIGNYDHPAFGRFVVFEDPSKRSQLRYKFGINMHGQLYPANDESNDDFLLTTDPPLAYRAVFFPERPHGYPISFKRVGDLVHSAAVSYLEFNDPPKFIKEVLPDPTTLTANSVGKQALLGLTAVLIILGVCIKNIQYWK